MVSTRTPCKHPIDFSDTSVFINFGKFRMREKHLRVLSLKPREKYKHLVTLNLIVILKFQ